MDFMCVLCRDGIGEWLLKNKWEGRLTDFIGVKEKYIRDGFEVC